MDPQIINTGDPAQDKQIAEEIKKGMESGGLKAVIQPAPSGGLAILAEMPEAAKVAAAASGVSQAALEPGTYDLGGTEAYKIKQRLVEGDHQTLRRLIAETSASGDWQDQYFMVDLVIASSLPGSLDDLLAKEPNAADLYLLRGAYAISRAWTERGAETVDKVTDEMWDKARAALDKAIPDLEKAAQLDPKNPVPYALMMRGYLIFDEDRDRLDEAFKKAVALAPDFLEPYWMMVNTESLKWGGSHEDSLEVARKAKAAAKAGGDSYACLFRAHILVWQYMKDFENNEAGAEEYLSQPKVRDELTSTFDEWTKEPYKPKRSSIPYLHYAAFWFFKTKDNARLKKAISATNNVICPMPWGYEAGGTLVYTQAYQQAMAG